MPIAKPSEAQLAFQEAANAADQMVSVALIGFENAAGAEDAALAAMLSGAMVAMVRRYAAHGRMRGEVVTEMSIIRVITPLLHKSAAAVINEILVDKS